MEEEGKAKKSFDERLEAARTGRGHDQSVARTGTRENDSASPWSVGLRVGVELVSALIVAVAIGYGLDWFFGTRPILTAVFVLLGGAAGVLNVWRLYAPR